MVARVSLPPSIDEPELSVNLIELIAEDREVPDGLSGYCRQGQPAEAPEAEQVFGLLRVSGSPRRSGLRR